MSVVRVPPWFDDSERVGSDWRVTEATVFRHEYPMK